MIKVPEKLAVKYTNRLKILEKSPDEIRQNLKWLHYYLDFCKKYNHPYAERQSR